MIKESYNVFAVEGASNVFTMNFDTIEAHELLPCDVIINESGQMLEVDYIEESNGLYHVTFLNNNCDPTIPFELGCQFVTMEYQYVDSNMDTYMKSFKNSAFKLKDDSLR